MTSHVAKPDMTIVVAIAALCGIHSKTYCYPSQQTITELLSSKYNTKLSRRALNNHLGALESQGWLSRTRRHRVTDNGTEWRSTMYAITRKAQRFIARTTQHLKGVVAKLDLKSLFKARVKKPAHNSLLKSNIIGEGSTNVLCPSPIDPTAFFEMKKRQASNAVKAPEYVSADRNAPDPFSTMPEGFLGTLRSMIKPKT